MCHNEAGKSRFWTPPILGAKPVLARGLVQHAASPAGPEALQTGPRGNPPPDDSCPKMYRLYMCGQPLVCTWAQPARSHFQQVPWVRLLQTSHARNIIKCDVFGQLFLATMRQKWAHVFVSSATVRRRCGGGVAAVRRCGGDAAFHRGDAEHL